MTDAEQKLSDIHMLIRLIVNERVSDLDLREDAEQEAMLAAWQRLEQGHGYGIAVHGAKQAAIDVGMGKRMTGSRSRGKPITRTTSLIQPGEGGDEYVIEPADAQAESAYDAVDALASLETLLEPLDDDSRSLVLLRLEGLTTRQIAPSLGISHQAVSGRLNRAFEIIRGSLEAS